MTGQALLDRLKAGGLKVKTLDDGFAMAYREGNVFDGAQLITLAFDPANERSVTSATITAKKNGLI